MRALRCSTVLTRPRTKVMLESARPAFDPSATSSSRRRSSRSMKSSRSRTNPSHFASEAAWKTAEMPTKRPRCCVGKLFSSAHASTKSPHNANRLGSTGPSSVHAGRVSFIGPGPQRSSRALTRVRGRFLAKNASSWPCVNFMLTRGVRFPNGMLCTIDDSKLSARLKVTWLEPEPAESVPAKRRARSKARMSLASVSKAL
mmetsp:Transcript_98157/g.274814  ORF Transcript_98157/g.274814 Transcript_98157/m.274814 type:complete len:201 (-) Transcript_98157:618-1220(-)